MKPLDLIYIGRATSFACNKQEKHMQQTTGFDVSIVLEYLSILPINCWWAGSSQFTSCLISLMYPLQHQCLVCAPLLVFLSFCWTIARYNSYVWKHGRVDGTIVFLFPWKLFSGFLLWRGSVLCLSLSPPTLKIAVRKWKGQMLQDFLANLLSISRIWSF